MSWTPLERMRLVLPAFRLAWRYLDDEDAWHSVPHDVPMAVYGPGNLVDDFLCYLEGPSRVSVKAVREVDAWLRSCEYQSDAVLFGRRDYWQHPTGFEELRRGDCEDHSLWAWRKLIELGHETELQIGQTRRHDDETEREWHAWVVFAEHGQRFLLESTAKRQERMIRPLAEVAGEYWPHASVDHLLQRRLYGGFVEWWSGERARRKARREAESGAAAAALG